MGKRNSPQVDAEFATEAIARSPGADRSSLGSGSGRPHSRSAPHGRLPAVQAGRPSQPGYGVRTGMLRDASRLSLVVGTLLYGRDPGRSLRTALAPAAQQADPSESRRGDPSGALLVLLPGHAVHRRDRPSGAGHDGLVSGRLWLDRLSRGRLLPSRRPAHGSGRIWMSLKSISIGGPP